jgi:hypothetical protein
MNNPSDPIPDPPDAGSGFISRSDDVPDPVGGPPAADHAWLQSLLFPDGSQLIDYGDGILLIDEAPPYGKGVGGDDIASAVSR